MTPAMKQAKEALEYADGALLRGEASHGGVTGQKVRAALASLAAAIEGENGWRPIESAPIDGTKILLTEGQTVGEGYGWFTTSSMGGFLRYKDYGKATAIQFTHWRPLPTPPEAA